MISPTVLAVSLGTNDSPRSTRAFRRHVTRVLQATSPGPTAACCGCRSRARRWTASATRDSTASSPTSPRRTPPCTSSSITPPPSTSPATVYTARQPAIELERGSSPTPRRHASQTYHPGWGMSEAPAQATAPAPAPAEGPGGSRGSGVRMRWRSSATRTSHGLTSWRRPATSETVGSRPRLVSLLALIAQSHKITIFALASDHGPRTNHEAGAADIAIVDDDNCQPPDRAGACWELAVSLARIRGCLHPTEEIYYFDPRPWLSGRQRGRRETTASPSPTTTTTSTSATTRRPRWACAITRLTSRRARPLRSPGSG